MPPASDPNYFVRRAGSGPERDNPLSPSQPAAASRPPTPSVHYTGTMAGQAAVYRPSMQATSRDYAEAAVSYYQTLRYPWHFASVVQTYEPINTLHEKIAIACANDPEDGARWASRSESDRAHYRRVADRVLQLIPVPGAKEES